MNWEGSLQPQFFDCQTEKKSFDDPRLGPLPEGWHAEGLENGQKPIFWTENRNETTTSDPRISVEALKKRGVDVRTILLA